VGRILNDPLIQQIRDVFADLQEAVQILYFETQDNCEYCEQARGLLEEVAAVNRKVSLSVYDLEADKEVASRYNVTKAPGLVIAARDGEQITDYGIRFSGIPSGHEFSTLINDILLVSKRDSGLAPETRKFLKALDQPLLLQVFVTPSCPYCPRAVYLAHQMALENPRLVLAEGVEAMEFPDLADRFNVQGVPQTVINSGAGIVVGAVPESSLLNEIQRALQN